MFNPIEHNPPPLSLFDRVRRLKSLHADERGTISILTVFALLMFTMLLVMVTNAARHADDKIRMQNAADASAQTAGVVLARGMNSIAFTNHLLSEVFALTAYMREAKLGETGTASLVPQILEEWRKTGEAFQQAGEAAEYEKFRALGEAIQGRIDIEQAVVDAWVEVSAAHSEMLLPSFEYILGGPEWSGTTGPHPSPPPPDPLGGFIPRFQRAVVLNAPVLAHLSSDEIAGRYGRRAENQHRGIPLTSRIWRTDVQMVGVGAIDESDASLRTLPAVDPSPTGVDSAEGAAHFDAAVHERERLAKQYLEQWIYYWMAWYYDFNHRKSGMDTAKMSNLINLWRSACCEHLRELLDDEYPTTNLPHMIRSQPAGNADLEREYTFVGVAYWPHLRELAPGLFRNPLHTDGHSDALTFAQVTLFVPRARFVKQNGSWVYWVWQDPPGVWIPVPYRDNWSADWNLFNQNWMAKLTPAASESILPILQQQPGGGSAGSFRPPRLSGATMDDVRAVNSH